MEFRIIPREEWGAAYGDGDGPAQVPASEVWLHHSVTVAPDVLPPFDDDYAAIRLIDQIGAERFGDVYGFPYTWAVTPVGLIFAGHNPGKNGAHTLGRNSVARAIVLVGNYEEQEPTDAQQNAVAWLLRQVHADGWINSPQLSGGHQQAPGQEPTACPGRHALAAIPTINQLAASGAQLSTEEDDLIPQDRQTLYDIARALDRIQVTQAQLGVAIASQGKAVAGGGDVGNFIIANYATNEWRRVRDSVVDHDPLTNAEADDLVADGYAVLKYTDAEFKARLELYAAEAPAGTEVSA